MKKQKLTLAEKQAITDMTRHINLFDSYLDTHSIDPNTIAESSNSESLAFRLAQTSMRNRQL